MPLFIIIVLSDSEITGHLSYSLLFLVLLLLLSKVPYLRLFSLHVH